MIEISMIFHILKDPNAYRQEIMQSSNASVADWLSKLRKMRNEIIVCNYKFLRDTNCNSTDNSWIITGLNHWLPNEYFH